jgi:hypothetical protein
MLSYVPFGKKAGFQAVLIFMHFFPTCCSQGALLNWLHYYSTFPAESITRYAPTDITEGIERALRMTDATFYPALSNSSLHGARL